LQFYLILHTKNFKKKKKTLCVLWSTECVNHRYF
jgi:hypothetical protein